MSETNETSGRRRQTTAGGRPAKGILRSCWEAVISGKLAEWSAIPSGVGLFCMMTAMAVHVVGRKFGRPVPTVVESTEGLMMAVAFLPLAHIALRRGHVQFELLTRRLPRKVRTALDAIGSLLGAVIFGGITWAGWHEAWQGMLTGEYRMGIINYPVWPFRFVFCAGFGLFTFYLLVIGIKGLKQVFSRN